MFMSTYLLAYHLHTLEDSGLIQATPQALEPAYLFRHALVQDAAYASLLRTDRTSLHLAVGEVLETLSQEEAAEERAAVLGHHFRNGGDEARALRYFVQAGDTAAQRYANAEAIEYYTQALQLAQETAPLETLRHVYGQRGRALELNAQYTAALADYEAMEAVATAHNNLPMVFDAVVAQATLRSTFTPVYDEALSLQLTERILQLAQALNDPQAEVRAHWIRMNALAYRYATPEAMEHGERAVALARAHNFRMELAFALNDIATNYLELNRQPEALAAYLEASALWRAVGNKPMLADSLLSLVRLYAALGQDDAAQIALEEGYAISQSIGNAVGQTRALGSLAWAHMENGEIAQALEHYATGERIIQTYDLQMFAAFRYLNLAQTTFYIGAYTQCLNTAHQAYTLFVKYNQEGEGQGSAQVLHVRALTALGQLSQAASELEVIRAQLANANPEYEPYRYWALGWLEWALASQRPQEVVQLATELLATQPETNNLLRSILYWSLKGRAYQQLEQWAAARAAFDRALQLARRRPRFWHWQPLALLGQTERMLGNPTAAATYAAEAQAILQYVLEHTPPEFRAGLLSLPGAQALNATT